MAFNDRATNKPNEVVFVVTRKFIFKKIAFPSKL